MREPPEPKGKFSIEEFEQPPKVCVVLKSERLKWYLDSKARPKRDSLLKFWRKLGAM